MVTMETKVRFFFKLHLEPHKIGIETPDVFVNHLIGLISQLNFLVAHLFALLVLLLDDFHFGQACLVLHRLDVVQIIRFELVDLFQNIMNLSVQFVDQLEIPRQLGREALQILNRKKSPSRPSISKAWL